MRDVIVIGNGIMGASIAGALRLQGRDVLVLDNHAPMSGTGPCGGSVKPSPLTGIPKDQEKPILETLNTLWGLTKETFQLRPSGGLLKANVWQINMDLVFAAPHTKVSNVLIAKRTEYPHVLYARDGDDYITDQTCRLLVVAAGMGSTELLPDIFPAGSLTAKQGVSFRFAGQVDHPFVQPWAPYKQITVHNIGPNEIWAADGSALKPENWTDERTVQSRERIQKAMGTTADPIRTLMGLRSFHASHRLPCFLEQVNPRVWVAVGAGKFGCIAAGWAANQMMEVR